MDEALKREMQPFLNESIHNHRMDRIQQEQIAEAMRPAIESRQAAEKAQRLLGELAQANRATEFYDRLLFWIKDFDSALDQSKEVGIRLVSFGQSIVFRVTNLGCHDPSLIIFHGETDDGSPVTLVQHVSQLSFLLTALPRRNPDEPKGKFGFPIPGQTD
jgi:hypothetical protein